MEHNEGHERRRIEDLLPLAKALRDAIDRRVDAQREEPASPIDEVIDAAFIEVVQPLIAGRLESLSPADFAALYGRVMGNEALAAELEKIRAVKQAALEREARLTEIGYEALKSGMLRLSKLSVHEIIEVGLFDASLPQFASRQFAGNIEHRALHRVIGLRLIEPQRGRVQVLHDTWVGPTWAQSQRGEPLPPHARAVIGIPGDDDIEPVLSARAPLAYRISDERMMPSQLVGYVELGTGEVLLGA
jgi:hypothetical protein